MPQVLASKLEQLAILNPIPVEVAKKYVLWDDADGKGSAKQRQQEPLVAGAVASGAAARPQLPTHAQMLARHQHGAADAEGGAGGRAEDGRRRVRLADSEVAPDHVAGGAHSESSSVWHKLTVEQVRGG